MGKIIKSAVRQQISGLPIWLIKRFESPPTYCLLNCRASDVLFHFVNSHELVELVKSEKNSTEKLNIM